MSYLTFHFVFLLPPIVLLLLIFGWPLTAQDEWRPEWAIPLVCVIALSYTAPWDNYLVARSIWWYGPDRVLGTIGYVPVEEYVFFLLQPLLTGLFTYQYLSHWNGSPRTSSSTAAWAGAIAGGGLTAVGVVSLFAGGTDTVYLGLILTWAAPLLGAMWLYDGEMLWTFRMPLLVAAGVPTLYLWVVDAAAIHQGIWTISPRYSTGIDAFGLPVEEALFFLCTNLLVVQGILLLLHGEHEGEPRTQYRTS